MAAPSLPKLQLDGACKGGIILGLAPLSLPWVALSLQGRGPRSWHRGWQRPPSGQTTSSGWSDCRKGDP